MPRVIYESQFGQNPDGTWWYTVTLHHLGHYWTAPGVTFAADDEDTARAHVQAKVRALAVALSNPEIPKERKQPGAPPLPEPEIRDAERVAGSE